MYSYIKGSILEIDGKNLSVLPYNSGTGFDITVSSLVLHNLKVGEEIELILYHHITENNQGLFGFNTSKEKKVFKTLLKISGIGPKAGIEILSLGVNNILKAIEESDDKLFTTVSGVGPKMAKKIILELKDKVTLDDVLDLEEEVSTNGNKEIIDTLVNMGYDRGNVIKITKEIPDNILDLKEKIVYCIKTLSVS